MSYVIVSLVGDLGTIAADEFAMLIKQHHAPVDGGAFQVEHPAHDDVRDAVAPVRRAIIIGHNGKDLNDVPSLRAKMLGIPWASVGHLGRIFANARVYAFACDSMGADHSVDPTALGYIAKQSGVAAFAGHTVKVSTVWLSDTPARDRPAVCRAFLEMIFAFLDGQNDESKLKLIARGSFNLFDEGIVLNDPTSRLLSIPDSIKIAIESFAVAA